VLLSRYGAGIEHILSLDFHIGFSLYLKANEKQIETDLYLFYCNIYPHMDNKISFNEFLQNIKSEAKRHDKFNDDEIQLLIEKYGQIGGE
jgi:hypothetical protein